MASGGRRDRGAGARRCVAAGTSPGSGQRRAGPPTKLTIWVGWSARELRVFKKVVAEYDKASIPSITVKVVGGINDDKIVAAIRAGNAPDVVSSFNSVQRRQLLRLGRLDRPRPAT